ncbi:MAG: DUF3253 domain-containing protein [Chloroflexi bacterium]|jgi:hypothetical protein|nr:DUF3253 domain-containing protein [Chloroflexota bacterium]MBP8058250.1 DUF3253 domain-containing protein [Chloroflexota bacterium]
MPTLPDPNQPQKKRRIADDLVKTTILEQCAAAGPQGYTTPEAVAQAIYPEKWQTLLKRIRLFARQMAEAGQIVILRKGQVADPGEVKGLIRLRLAPPTAEE